MDKLQTLSQIADVLDVALLQTHQLIKNPEKFSAIEADVIKDYLRIAYDKLNVLVFISTPADEENSKDETKSDVNKSSVETKEQDPKIDEKHEPTILNVVEIPTEKEVENPVIQKADEEKIVVKETIIEETLSESTIQEDTITEEEIVQDNFKVQQITTEFHQEELIISTDTEKHSSENHIIAEKFNESSKSIGDNLEKNSEEHTLFSKISKIQSGDLKKAIGINDRFLFTNELFLGNISAYNQFIDEIDKFDDALKAWEYIEHIKSKKRWDSTSSSYKRLFEIIQKKFFD